MRPVFRQQATPLQTGAKSLKQNCSPPPCINQTAAGRRAIAGDSSRHAASEAVKAVGHAGERLTAAELKTFSRLTSALRPRPPVLTRRINQLAGAETSLCAVRNTSRTQPSPLLLTSTVNTRAGRPKSPTCGHSKLSLRFKEKRPDSGSRWPTRGTEVKLLHFVGVVYSCTRRPLRLGMFSRSIRAARTAHGSVGPESNTSIYSRMLAQTVSESACTD